MIKDKNLIKVIKENGEVQYVNFIILPNNFIYKFNGYVLINGGINE
jgi:hypothetical protein